MSGGANVTRILWKYSTIAIAKIGIVTLELSEDAAGARDSPFPSPISTNLWNLLSSPHFCHFIAIYDSSRQLIPSLYNQ